MADKKRFKLLEDPEEIKKAIKSRHLVPVRVKNANGFVTIADYEDYYDNSYAQKNRFEPISWDEFFEELDKRNLYVVQDVKTGYIKIVRKRFLDEYSRYFL